MREVGKLTQVYTLGDELGFELSGGGTISFKYGKHKEGLLGLLIKLGEELGRVPTFEDVLNCPAMPHPNTFAPYFGSFDKAKEQVEQTVRRKKWEEERGIETKAEPEAARRNENQNEESRKERGRKMKRRKWTQNEIISLVIRKEKELGRFPSQKDLNSDPELPSYQTIANKFGGLRELRAEVEERKKKMGVETEKPSETQEEVAVQAILDLINPPKKVEEVPELVVPEVAPEEEVPEDVAEEASEEVVEEEVVENEPEVVSGGVEEKKERKEGSEENSGDGETEPIQTTMEIENVDGKKVIRLVFTLEISFPTK